MEKYNILSRTISANYEINKKASLLSINQCKNYLKMVIRHLNEVLDRLNDQKSLILYKITPTLAPDAVRESGLLCLKERMEEMAKFIDSCEVNGKKTIAASQCNGDKSKCKCSAILFPMTSGLVFTEEPTCYDPNSQNLVFQPVLVGLYDLCLLSLYKQLCNYFKYKKPINCCDEEEDECRSFGSYSSKSNANSNCNKSNDEHIIYDDNIVRSNIAGKDINNEIGQIDFDLEREHEVDDDNNYDDAVDIIDDKVYERLEYTKCIYVWKYKFEKAIEKVSSLMDVINSRIEILEMRKNFIIAETRDKIDLNNLFDDIYSR